MIIRQFIDFETHTYTYLVMDNKAKKAILIDPVYTQVNKYIQLLNELGVKLIAVMDTHIHADHITGIGALSDLTGADAYIGLSHEAYTPDQALRDNQTIMLNQTPITAIYTPGHTNDSFCFYIESCGKHYLFTGDTLLIRGTGRTDFQDGNAGSLYDSIHNKLLTLPDQTIVYPAHDYNGFTQSTIQEERKYNTRLQIPTKNEFVTFMAHLNLPKPKYMDVAIPANLLHGRLPDNTH